MAKQTHDKEPVKLRRRPLANGNTSLYLDIYYKGRRTYDFMRLYLTPERTPLDRAKNAETLRLANTIKAQRILELQAAAHGLATPGARGKAYLRDFIDQEIARYEERGSIRYATQLRALVAHLTNYRGDRTRIDDVDTAFVEGFIAYLRRYRRPNGTTLRESTQCTYTTLLGSVANRAVRLGIIPKNPLQQIAPGDRPQMKCRTRDYLTLAEVQKLHATPCRINDLKQAFLFCCFCGLRLSDVTALRWRAFRVLSDGTTQIAIVQQKTGAEAFIPLSHNAVALLPPAGAPGDLVFRLPAARTTLARTLADWATAASIPKRITFHVSRHTYATLLLTYGADLYTVSKLLGHTNVKTTQIYAKVVDEKKRQAVELIPRL